MSQRRTFATIQRMDAPADEHDDPAPPGDGKDDSTVSADNQEPFGRHPATRFGADVRYTGRVREHDYEVEVRHRLLDTTAVVIIDGVRHHAKAEKKLAAVTGAAEVDTEDGLVVRLDEGFTRNRFAVRRPTVKGEMKDREAIVVRTAGLGGAGEVDVVRNEELRGTPLVPEDGSPSAAREQRKAEHPVRFGLIAAVGTAAKYLIPLLGLGALFSGLLRPVIAWFRELVRPVVEWVDELTRPLRDWLADLLRPVAELVERILQPVRDAVRWLIDLLFGWIPDIDLQLSFSIPEWAIRYGVPAVVVLGAFLITFSGIRSRRKRLDAARSGGRTAGDSAGGSSGARAETDEDAGDPESDHPGHADPGADGKR